MISLRRKKPTPFNHTRNDFGKVQLKDYHRHVHKILDILERD